MKKTFCMFAVAALAAAGFCEYKKESPAERFARVRELVARHSASTVTVLVRFNAPEDEGDDVPQLQQHTPPRRLRIRQGGASHGPGWIRGGA